MVGALNKLPLALSGMVFFGDPATLSSTSAIGVGFIAGYVGGCVGERRCLSLPISVLLYISSSQFGPLMVPFVHCRLVYAYAKNKQSEEAKRAAAIGSSPPSPGGRGGARNEAVINMHSMNGKEDRND